MGGTGKWGQGGGCIESAKGLRMRQWHLPDSNPFPALISHHGLMQTFNSNIADAGLSQANRGLSQEKGTSDPYLEEAS